MSGRQFSPPSSFNPKLAEPWLTASKSNSSFSPSTSPSLSPCRPSSPRPFTPPPLQLSMSPEGQAALQRSIREVMEDTTSPVETLSRTGADTTYAVRKELQSRREKTPEGSPGVSPKLRAATEPFHQRESEVAALMGPQGFRRHHMMEKAEAPRDFVYATFLEHMEHFCGVYDVGEEGEPLLDHRGEGTSDLHTFLIAMKGFIGPAILYLAAAWASGGFAFSIAGMVLCCAWNYMTMLMLFAAHLKLKAGYGEMGRIIGGRWLGRLVDLSLILQQLAICCTYFIFVSQSLIHAINYITNCRYAEALGGQRAFAAVCAAQLVVYLPLSFIRKMKHLTIPAITADILLVFSLGYLFYHVTDALVRRGPHEDTKWVVGESPSVFCGIAIFAFEGIGIVLPIATSMQHPEHFPHVMGAVSLILLVLMLCLGSLGYLVFGPHTNPDVLVDVSNDAPNAVLPVILLVAYPVAVICGYPIQFLPGAHIVDVMCGIKDEVAKSAAMRVGLNLLLLAVAIKGGSNFDHFVSISGALCCIPLALVYPPLLHFYSCAGSKWVKLFDGVFVGLGVFMIFFILIPSVRQWVEGPPAVPEPCIPHY